MKNSDMPAHPTKGGMVFYIPESLGKDVKESCEAVMKEQYHGLTKRELIAAMAMQGLLAHPQGFDGADLNEVAKNAASESVMFADALLAELEGK